MESSLRSAEDFSRVMRKGKAVATPDLVVHTFSRGDGAPGRLGLVVAKKGRGAVARNRAKRQLREAVRLAGGVRRGTDCVIVLKRGKTVDVNAARLPLGPILEESVCL